MSLHSQELVPRIPRFPFYLFICVGVLISTSRRGALGLRTSATVPCRARQGIQEVCTEPQLWNTGACAHAAGSTPQAAAPLPLLLCDRPRTHFLGESPKSSSHSLWQDPSVYPTIAWGSHCFH